ncbi:MAG: FIST C-terminal domain-containing protein [Bacteroidales bacterium]|nr:FIST C-terminal domain-containing protein [Bacteroidales bacterium]
MKTFQFNFFSENDQQEFSPKSIPFHPDLVLFFGSRKLLSENSIVALIKSSFPKAILMGCSTSGEISGINVSDHSITLTAIQFDNTKIIYHEESIADFENGEEAGKALATKLASKDLRHVFVLSEGLHVNGTELVTGMRNNLPEGVNVTGGLAGDGADFNQTLIVSNSGTVKSNIITAIGFYGENIVIGYGSFGGWDSFGVERSVTRSKGNVVYEIDNTPALELYKSFLGEQAKDLPASGLLFPLNMRIATDSDPVVRTILAVDEEKQSLTFAGDIPEGSYVKLMKANSDRLIGGAEKAAEVSIGPLLQNKADLAILISCVGRKLVLKQLIEEEVEVVQDILGTQAAITGFYSYGEIAPFTKGTRCELHNQTMTITTFAEV